MDFFEAVKARYSHKQALDPNRPVAKEDLAKIVEAGMAAPSAGNGQSPEFVVIDDPELLAKLRPLHDNVPFSTAPAMVALLTKPRVRETLDIQTECLLCDLAAATQNVLLAAAALGYCGGWLDSPFTDVDVRSKAQAILGIPEDRMLLLVVPIGYPGEEGERRVKKPFAERASWNGYSVQR